MTQAIDMQVLIPRTQDVGRIQHIQQTNEQSQQQNFAARLLQESENAQKTVQNLPQTKEGKIKEEGRKKEQFTQQQNMRENRSNEADEPSSNQEKAPDQVLSSLIGSVIDLKI